MAKIPVGKRITSRDLESSQYPNVFRYVQHSDGKTGILIEDGFQFEVTSPEALEGIQAAQSAATQARDIASAAQATAQEARGNALAETLAFSYVEHRYARATAQPDTPMGVDPVGWTLTVPAGTETVWLSYASRRGDGALLSAWSTPATRMDSHPWMIFKRSATAPETPSGANPAGWYFAPPAGLEPLWASSGRFVYEGGPGAGVVRPHIGLRPRVGLHPASLSWSTPYLAVNATTGRNSGYLGKFTTHPLSRAGDTWLIYGVGDTPVQRGVWINESGTRRRLASESAADSLYIAQALSDILEVVNTGYGVVSDYGSITYFTNLAAYSLFANQILANDIEATGRLRSTAKTGSGEYVPVVDREAPLVDIDMNAPLITLRDDTTGVDGAFRKVRIGPSFGLKAYGYDTHGGNERVIHDLPDAPVGNSSMFRDYGHLYGLLWNSEVNIFYSWNASGETFMDVTDESTRRNIDVSAYVCGCKNAKALTAHISISQTMMLKYTTETTGHMYFRYYMYPEDAIGAAYTALSLVFSRNIYVCPQVEHGDIVIPINYVDGVPYITVSGYAHWTSLSSSALDHDCRIDLRPTGFYA